MMRRNLLKLGTALALCLGCANLANATQDGGVITLKGVIDPSNFVGPLPSLSVDASGNGNGGVILIQNTTNIDLSNLTGPNAITARGAGTGDGGLITIDMVAKTAGLPDPLGNPTFKQLDVLNVFNVNPGSGVTDPSTFGGYISINGVTCVQQLKNPGGAWPQTYWDCANGVPTDLDQEPWNVASSPALSGVQGALGSANTAIFVFENGGSPSSLGYDAFFGDNLQDVNGGVTFPSPLGNYIYVNPLESGSIGDPKNTVDYTVTSYQEVAAHELGHAVDINNGKPTKNNTDYIKYVNRDVYDLNNATVSGAGVTRNPCTPTAGSTDTAPFAGVVDLVDPAIGGVYQYVCTGTSGIGGALNANIIANLHTGAPTNDEVLAYIESLWTIPAEINAQTFAYKAVGNKGARPTNDKVLANGGVTLTTPRYLGCVEAWAVAQLAGQTAGPATVPSTPSGSCTAAP